ncbi:MAG: alpha-amylase, partial [Chitinophagaceae bacterium]|nr:alpha-amylase [Chitinophagaceae bacterium]
IDGFRLDALKHITPNFFPEWLDHLNRKFRKEFFCVGEYWQNNVYALMNYIATTGERVRLFDVPLHFNFYDASQRGDDYDLRQIFDNSLVREKPESAITFVDNHDTQPLQSLQSTVEYWFKPLANAMTLLRDQGIPCLFYPTLYEAKYIDYQNGEEIYIELNNIEAVGTMAKVRRLLAYGPQHDYFNHAHMIGWTREGIDEKQLSGCAVLLSNSVEGQEEMYIGERHAGKVFIDVCGGREERVEITSDGKGIFFTHGRSVSVWVQEGSLS